MSAILGKDSRDSLLDKRWENDGSRVGILQMSLGILGKPAKKTSERNHFQDLMIPHHRSTVRMRNQKKRTIGDARECRDSSECRYGNERCVEKEKFVAVIEPAGNVASHDVTFHDGNGSNLMTLQRPKRIFDNCKMTNQPAEAHFSVNATTVTELPTFWTHRAA